MVSADKYHFYVVVINKHDKIPSNCNFSKYYYLLMLSIFQRYLQSCLCSPLNCCPWDNEWYMRASVPPVSILLPTLRAQNEHMRMKSPRFSKLYDVGPNNSASWLFTMAMLFKLLFVSLFDKRSTLSKFISAPPCKCIQTVCACLTCVTSGIEIPLDLQCKILLYKILWQFQWKWKVSFPCARFIIQLGYKSITEI